MGLRSAIRNWLNDDVVKATVEAKVANQYRDIGAFNVLSSFINVSPFVYSDWIDQGSITKQEEKYFRSTFIQYGLDRGYIRETNHINSDYASLLEITRRDRMHFTLGDNADLATES